MFNFSGSEIVFLLLLALIILGPEKLPEAIRKFGKTYAEFKKVTTGFQTELKQALDEPMREMRETAEMFKQAASLDLINPMEEAASALKSITDPTPAAVTSSTAGDADTDTDADGAVDAAAGAAPPLASAAAEATTASANDEHKPFESKVISGGQKMRSLDEVLAATQADAAKAEAAKAEATKAEATKATATDSAAVSARPAGPAFHSAAPRVTPPVETPQPSTETPADRSDPGAPVVADASGDSAEDEQGPGTA